MQVCSVATPLTGHFVPISRSGQAQCQFQGIRVDPQYLTLPGFPTSFSATPGLWSLSFSQLSRVVTPRPRFPRPWSLLGTPAPQPTMANLFSLAPAISHHDMLTSCTAEAQSSLCLTCVPSWDISVALPWCPQPEAGRVIPWQQWSCNSVGVGAKVFGRVGVGDSPLGQKKAL